MKKIYALLLVATGTVLSATAQPFEKGDKLLGGSIGYSLSKSTSAATATSPAYDYRYVSFGVSPSIGFFTKPNRLTGFSLLYSHRGSLSNGGNYDDRGNTYGAGFYQQYWNNLGKSFYFIIQGKTGVNYSDYFNGSTNSTQNYKSTGIDAYLSIDPGFAYRIKRRLVLDVYYSNFLLADLGYGQRKRNGVEESKTYSFNANTGLQNFSLSNVIFGFRYLL